MNDMVNKNKNNEIIFEAKIQSRGEEDRMAIEIPTRHRKTAKSWGRVWVKLMKDLPIDD